MQTLPSDPKAAFTAEKARSWSEAGVTHSVSETRGVDCSAVMMDLVVQRRVATFRDDASLRPSGRSTTY
jgi:hypothetical protein